MTQTNFSPNRWLFESSARVPMLDDLDPAAFDATLCAVFETHLQAHPELFDTDGKFPFTTAGTELIEHNGVRWHETYLPPRSAAQQIKAIGLLAQAIDDSAPPRRVFAEIKAQRENGRPTHPIEYACCVNETELALTLGDNYAEETRNCADQMHYAMLETIEADPDLHTVDEDSIMPLVEHIQIGLRAPNGPIPPEFYEIEFRSNNLADFEEPRAIEAIARALAGLDDYAPDHLAILTRMLAAASRHLEPLLALVVTTHSNRDFPDPIVELEYMLGDVAIAAASYIDGTLSAGPEKNDESHAFELPELPPRNRNALLTTIAIRHAELHLLGRPFRHPAREWQAAVHDIATLIYATCRELPKWASLRPPGKAGSIQ